MSLPYSHFGRLLLEGVPGASNRAPTAVPPDKLRSGSLGLLILTGWFFPNHFRVASIDSDPIAFRMFPPPTASPGSGVASNVVANA